MIVPFGLEIRCNSVVLLSDHVQKASERSREGRDRLQVQPVRGQKAEVERVS